ncbi:hypothetical protein AOL_s00210g347 [Orbilia oligospora ATCC 24927]|uniref:Uncharacterized protein n=1 Tax=Arthrobotrys oligospora (strain ATCC 24927 / CBS 115.81 / DSM 1491) TaxID=756982 RepID=G1XSI8_ARTOA|nr:hypothetical protein AOL_s00210g347 [Orbilia oligospora ATCC 24927]EGX43900.1 hypothetical protein AOL_s00210g347 [Orbilia oligospora ATCC 24927]
MEFIEPLNAHHRLTAHRHPSVRRRLSARYRLSVHCPLHRSKAHRRPNLQKPKGLSPIVQMKRPLQRYHGDGDDDDDGRIYQGPKQFSRPSSKNKKKKKIDTMARFFDRAG